MQADVHPTFLKNPYLNYNRATRSEETTHLSWFANIFQNRLGDSAHSRTSFLRVLARVLRNIWWDVRNPQLVPPGHFYSAVPSRREIQEHLEGRGTPPRTLPDVDLNEAGQLALLRELGALYPQMPFTETAQPGRRFQFNNPAFSYTDAILLFCLLGKLRPARVIEIGSGWSTAAMLDTFDHWEMPTRLTCIEPYPVVLRHALRADDFSRIELRVERAQKIELALFEQLQANDVLFIDSTHVLKTGSDVAIILFQILPRLRSGVVVHLHDIFYPFEYPAEWVQDGLAWNEIYFIRALLASSSRYRVLLFPSFLECFHRTVLSTTMPSSAKGLAGSLWLEVV